MSEESRKAADAAKKNLQNAQTYIDGAKQNAGKVGDKGLVEKIQKADTAVKEATKHIEQKTDPKGS